MPTDRALLEIVTAANMAGVEQAQAGFLKLNAATLGLTAALGVLVVVGKSAIENTEAQEKAHKSLNQATDVAKLNFQEMQKAFDDWAEANKRYIPNQYAAETALAAFVRAGANEKDALRELNDALDLSTLRSMDMEEAQKNITLALTGSSKALKVLGITTEEYSAIMKDKTLTAEEKHHALLTLIESKTKDGRKAQTELTQSTQAMNKDWQDITTKVGPPLLGLFTFLVDKADALITALNWLGHNQQWNQAISAGLGSIQGYITGTIRGFQQLIAAVQWLIDHGGQLAKYLGGGNGPATPARPRGLASGGWASPYETLMVGERGPETLVMGSQGGTVVPHGGAGQVINIHIDQGAYIDGPSIDLLVNRIAQRLRVATGT